MAAEKNQFKMIMKLLSDNMQTRISSEVKIASVLQCVTELVFNSLDSKATAIAVRINTLSFQLQVIDNGEGITQENMELIGQRYMTSKCSSLSDLAKRCRYYGYKGESLASIRELSRTLSVTSRPIGQGETYYKIFSANKSPARVYKIKQRPTNGTTVNVEGFLFQHLVRQKQINPEIELEEIKKFLQSVGIIHPNVSLTLRNELTGYVVLAHPRSKTVLNAIINLCANLDRNYLHEIKVKKHNMSVSGLVYSKSHVNNKLQFIYVNKRLTELKSLNKLINDLIESKLFKGTGGEHPVYVFNIACPRFDFDCSQFKNWDLLLKCVEKLIEQVSGDSQAEIKRRSLSRTSKHMSKKVTSDSILEVKTKSEKQVQIGGSSDNVREQKRIKENKSEEIFKEKARESSNSNFLCFENCNLVGRDESKNVKQMQFGGKKSELKKQVREYDKDNFCLKGKSVPQKESCVSNFSFFEKRHNLIENKDKYALQEQKQKKNSSQDVIAEKHNLLCFENNFFRSEHFVTDKHKLGKEFIMDKFMKSLSRKNEANQEDTEYNILRDVSFVNEKGAKRLEKLNREANLIIINRLKKFNHNLPLLETQEQHDQSKASESKFIFCNHQNNPTRNNINYTQRLSELYNSSMPYTNREKKPHLPFEHSNRILNEKESTYKSNYNNIFLSNLSLCSQDKDFDVKEQFYRSIVKTCTEKSARFDNCSRLLTCRSDYVLSEDEYEKFKKDLDAYIHQETPGALLNKTVSTFIFKNNRKIKDNRPFHLNINFTEVYPNERLSEASKSLQMSLFCTSRRTSDAVSINQTQNWKPLINKVTRSHNISTRNLNKMKLFDINENRSSNAQNLNEHNINNLDIRSDVNNEGKWEHDFIPKENSEHLFVDAKIQNCETNSMSQPIKEWIDQDELHTKINKDGEKKEQLKKMDLNPVEKSEHFFVNVRIQNCETNLASQRSEEWIEQDELHTKNNKDGKRNEQLEKLDLNPVEKKENFLVDSTKQNCETNSRSQLVEEWIKQEGSDTTTYYLNTRTGMSSLLYCQSPTKFTFKKRSRFIPKGLSPIAKEVKEIDTSLPPSAKDRLQNAIIKVYDNDLEIIKNSATRAEDLQDFLDKYYEENYKKFGNFTLNAYNKHVSHEMYTFARNLFDELQIIGQFDLKFIVTLSSSGVIFLFDQHAVCERIQLEILLKDYTMASVMKYKSTHCKEFTIKFPIEDVCLINTYRHMFEHLGLCFKALEDQVLIRKVPLCFYNKSSKTTNNIDTLSCLVQNLIHEELILLRSTSGKFSKIPNCIRDVINTEACRGAVKFGDELSLDDCRRYIKQLSMCQLPFHCAHGRPSVIPLVKLGDAKENMCKRLFAPNLKKLSVNENVI